MQCAFDHLHVRTTDPEGVARWFENILNAEILRSTQEGKPRVDVKLGGQKIFIMPVSAAEWSNASPPPRLGLDHCGFVVENIDDVFLDLKRKGAEFSQEVYTQRPGIRVMFLRGPEGISIELLERNDKYAG